MITRVRIEAAGGTASEVERSLKIAAMLTESALNGSPRLDESADWPAKRIIPLGETHIERDVGEPEMSRWAWSGRTLLHLDVQEEAPQRAVLEGYGINVARSPEEPQLAPGDVLLDPA